MFYYIMFQCKIAFQKIVFQFITKITIFWK